MPRSVFVLGSSVLVAFACLCIGTTHLCRAQTVDSSGLQSSVSDDNRPVDTTTDADQTGSLSNGPDTGTWLPPAAPPPSNPITDSQDAKQPVLAGQRVRPPYNRLPDYRGESDPEMQRIQRRQAPLPLYGYDFFASARQIIEARRDALRSLLAAGVPRPAVRQLAPDRSITLTDVRKATLLRRKSLGTLTPAERVKYRSFLYPDIYNEDGSPRNPNYNPLTQTLPPGATAGNEAPTTTTTNGTSGATAVGGTELNGSVQTGVGPVEETSPDQLAPTAPGASEAIGAESAYTSPGAYGEYGASNSDTSTSTGGYSSTDNGANNNGENDNGLNDTGAYPSNDAGASTYPSTNKNTGGYPSSDTGGPRSETGGSENDTSEWPGDSAEYLSDIPSSPSADATTSTPPDNFEQESSGQYDNRQPGSRGQVSRESEQAGGVNQPPYPSNPQEAAPARSVLPQIDAYQQVGDPLATTLQQVVASAPTNYQLSGGDQVILRYSSPTLEEQMVRLRVDSAGGVDVPTAGRVIVRGDTLGQAETAITARMQPFYRDVVATLELGPLRTIPVTVSGASFYPGTYQVSAVTTAFNLIYATGGPTRDGSMRGIQVLRGGKVVATLDVYRLLQGGTGDVGLQAGDVIYYPGYASRVAVRGEVRRPAVFELKDNETLADALQFAQVKPSGVTQRVLVSTVDPGSSRLLKDVDVNDPANARAVKLYDGATVDVFSVRNDLVNKVTVDGAVDQPGDYALTPGMTVADLVESARGVTSETYTTRADLYRYNADTTLTHIPVDLDKALARDPAANILLTRWDRLHVYAREDVAFIGRRDVAVRGAVRHAGIYYRSDNLRVKDLLLQAGGTMPEAYTPHAALLHQRPDGSYAYEFIDLDEAMKENPADNVMLLDHDVLAVYTTAQAQFVPRHTFSIKGEVVTPGTDYPRGDGMRLSDALRLAGGPTPQAGDLIQLAHARQDQGTLPTNVTYSPQTGAVHPDPLLQDGDVITLPGRGSFQETPWVVNVAGAVNRPGPVILSGPQARLSDVIREAGGLKPEAYPEGAEFSRNDANLESTQQLRLTQVIDRVNNILNDAEYQRALAQSDLQRIAAYGSASRPTAQIGIPGYTQQQQGSATPVPEAGASNLFSRDLVSPPRRLTMAELRSSGNIAVNLAAALRHPGSEDDVTMQDGDIINVPVKPTTVEIVGAVFRSQGVVFRSGEPIQYYIDRAGGFTPDAARDRVLIIHVGGGLIPAQKVHSLQPGDVILVPTGVLAAKIHDHANDFNTIFTSLTTGVLTILVATKLFGL
ncbi:MAG: SLBB domain-containing protein [Capsulimonadaceae bacterium]